MSDKLEFVFLQSPTNTKFARRKERSMRRSVV